MPRAARGFTLIEMMVAVAVLLVLMALAVPSLLAVRQRAAVRAAAEQALGVWNQARLEATKRNTWVKVGMFRNVGGLYCFGAATATSTTDTTACDCFSATACDIARLGGTTDQADWRSSTLQESSIGGNIWPSVVSAPLAAVIEPKQATLAVATQKGYIAFTSPAGKKVYHLRLKIDQFGRGVLCQPTGDTDKLSDYGGRKC